jgi:hypothetical protein
MALIPARSCGYDIEYRSELVLRYHGTFQGVKTRLTDLHDQRSEKKAIQQTADKLRTCQRMIVLGSRYSYKWCCAVPVNRGERM